MNRTLNDFIGLFLALWVVFFISNLINPDSKDKEQITASFIGVAYIIGRSSEQEARKTPKAQEPQQTRPPIQYGGKTVITPPNQSSPSLLP